jgi:hypothetical protein
MSRGIVTSDPLEVGACPGHWWLSAYLPYFNSRGTLCFGRLWVIMLVLFGVREPAHPL